MSNNRLIIDSQYFPNVNYIYTALKAKDLYIFTSDAYQKMSFFNRTVISGANGPINLSLPLHNGRNQRSVIKDVEISFSTKWQEQHWRSIESAYSRAPYFEYYAPDIEKLVRSNFKTVLDLNLEILKWLKIVLDSPVRIHIADSPPPPRCEDFRYRWLPKNFRDLPLEFQYFQMFEPRFGFQPNLSIIDALFCAGPSLKTALKS